MCARHAHHSAHLVAGAAAAPPVAERPPAHQHAAQHTMPQNQVLTA